MRETVTFAFVIAFSAACLGGCGSDDAVATNQGGGDVGSTTGMGGAPSGQGGDQGGMGGQGASGGMAPGTGGGGGGGGASCLPQSMATVGMGLPPRTGATMRWFGNHATAQAIGWASDARLTQIMGSGFRADGTIDLSQPDGVGFWRFVFESDAKGEARSINYTAEDVPYPYTGNTSHHDHPALVLAELVDSDALAQEVIQAGCTPPAGTDTDILTVMGHSNPDPHKYSYLYSKSTNKWWANQADCLDVGDGVCP